MKIRTKYGLGDKVNLGLFDRHDEGDIAIIDSMSIDVKQTGRLEVTYHYYNLGNVRTFFTLNEDGKTEAAEWEKVCES